MKLSFSKKKKEEKEPEFYMSAINTPIYNYNVYNFKKTEKIIYILVAFIVGAFVGYIFYGGIGKDEYGPTLKTYICDILISTITGLILVKIFLPMRNAQIIKKRRNLLRTQFIALLDSLSTSIAAGKNVPQAFESAREDLIIQFTESSYIVEELNIIVEGLRNGMQIENMLADFGRRSGIQDIENFGKVFEVSYRRGANMKDIIRNTHDILSKKILIEAEIETKITSSRNELYVMLVMPVLLISMMKFTGGGFAENFVTPTGLVSTTVAIVLFVVSFLVGKKVMNIEV